MKQCIRKADIILLVFLILVGLAASAALSFSRVDAGADAKVIIESGGELYATYPLSEDRTFEVPAYGSGGSNTVCIADGKVSVTEASCKNQVCVHHGEISRSGESIVCLPNRLVVRIDAGGSGEGGGYDSVTS